jgi:hypothetical protein
MTSNHSTTNSPYPNRAIRRFDVFAEYNRLKGLQKGLDDPHAKGYGLWVAKVVASGGRHNGAATHREPNEGDKEQKDQGERHEKPPEQKWHELSGEPQTDKLFDHEIIARMGKGFYAAVFAPAIAEAVEQGRSYESIRDTIRKGWKPAHA